MRGRREKETKRSQDERKREAETERISIRASLPFKREPYLFVETRAHASPAFTLFIFRDLLEGPL